MTPTRLPIEPALEAELWRRHRDELQRFATALVGPNDADDVVADAFIRSRELLGSVEPPNVRAYLYRAVANQAVNHHRSRNRRWRRELASLVAPPTNTLDSYADVRDALMELSVQQRVVVYLVYWEDQPVTQVAETLTLSVSSVRKHLDRAQTKLRRALHD